MTILVDVEEHRSGVPAHLDELGVVFETVRLPVGDYAFGGCVAVERKTVADLHASLTTGRLWSQLFALRHATERPYLLVEGQNLDAGRVSARGVRGALLRVADSGIHVVRSSGTADTALWIDLMSRVQAARTTGTLRRRGRRKMAASPSGVLATIPGVSPVLANRLLDRFGSIENVARASRTELEGVSGIGRVRAAELHRVLTRCTH